MKKKTTMAFCLLATACAALTACGAGSTSIDVLSNGSNSGAASNSESEDYNTFSYFLPYASGSPYYSDYNDNPEIRYLTKFKKWGPNNSTLKFTFDVPPTESVESTFNTAMASGDLDDLFMPTSNTNAKALYQNGYSMDLTELVNEYMPNYKSWIDTHETVKQAAYININGEKKILEIGGYGATGDPWEGFEYRRDWLVKYGTNPVSGAAFTGGWTDGVWSDDVVFPNGTSDPIYISDWEWMFGIFTKALAAEKITDGYCMSIYYPGYLGTGDLVSAFGGGGPQWYKNNGTIYFGGTSDNFRAYVQGMNSWYKKGWLDKAFTTRTSDMFYATNTVGVVNGKVGLFQGLVSYLGNGLQETLPGSCIYPAKQPINDVYGPASAKGVTPYTFYQLGDSGTSVAINIKCQGKKNVPAFLSMMDYRYSDEGARIGWGFTKEQNETIQDPLYAKYGLTDGAYKYVDSTGADWVEGTSTGDKLYKVNDILEKDGTLYGALVSCKIPGHGLSSSLKYRTERPEIIKGLKDWSAYTATGDVIQFSAMFNALSDKDLDYCNSRL
jgi:ABC-type glycerol-3-phosphate transport system substrate-binding protein